MIPTLLQFNSGKITAKTSAGDKTLVEDFSFELKTNDSIAIIGQTGSGKTMTALAIMGLLPSNVKINGGSILFCGKELRKAGQRKMRRLLGSEIVYIPQNAAEFFNPSKKIKYHFFDSYKKQKLPKRKWMETTQDSLRYLGFWDADAILEAYSFELSGGMAQRAAIALAMNSKVKLVIADEASNGLDNSSKKDFMTLMKLAFPAAGLIMITHDFDIAADCKKIAVLKSGKVEEQGICSEVLANPQSEYTKMLVEALNR